MDVTISPGALSGTAGVPPSKSYTHRAILAAGCSEGGTIENPLWSADTRATASAVEAFGGSVDRGSNGHLEVTGFGGRPSVPEDVVDCANSGTTMRLVTAVAGLVDGTTVLTGDASLRSRPQGPLLAALESLGASARSTRANGQAPLVVDGPIEGGRVSLPGDVSSQYVSALLVAGGLTERGIEIELETPLKSAPYVEITREVLSAFGVTTDGGSGRDQSNERAQDSRSRDGDTPSPADFRVAGGQRFELDGRAYAVPGDFSSLAFVLAAGAIAGGKGITITGIRESAQGDRAILEHVERFGASVDWDREAGTVAVSSAPLSGITVSVADTPDLLPILATLGAVADGETRIVDAEHVRYKETDRIAAMVRELGRLGAKTTESQDELVVHGGDSSLDGGTVDGHGDHRIVMALAVAALAADGETTIHGAEHVDVSFPDFFETLESLGVSVDRST